MRIYTHMYVQKDVYRCRHVHGYLDFLLLETVLQYRDIPVDALQLK